MSMNSRILRCKDPPGGRVSRASALSRTLALWTLSCVIGCEPTDPAEDPTPSAIDPPRLVEVGMERGLTRDLSDPLSEGAVDGFGGHTVASDWDADGDIDLLFDRIDEGPDLYENDGTGHFSLHTNLLVPHAPGSVFPMLYALGADLDADGLPELILGGDAALAVYPNLGGLSFGTPTRLWEEPGLARGATTTAQLGDLDGDGDLDLLLPTSGPYPEAPEARSTGEPFPDRVATWDGGRWVHTADLYATEEGSIALAAMMTDLDDDGVLDLLIPGDQEFPTALWHNDGLVEGALAFSDQAVALGAQVRLGAMGVDGTDWNGDGRLDFCMSNTGRLFCLQSTPGGFVEAGLSLGIDVDDPQGDFGTVGWSVAFADLNRDGRPELLQASGPFSYGDVPLTVLSYPCLLFSQGEDGLFTDLTAESGLDVWGDHPGVVTADFDGDHCTDVVFAGPRERPRLYLGACTGGGWIEVDLEAAGALGFGVSVEVKAGGRTQVRQRSSLLAAGQSSGVLLFGLGDSEVAEEINLRWPGGRETQLTDVRSGERIDASAF